MNYIRPEDLGDKGESFFFNYVRMLGWWQINLLMTKVVGIMK